MLKKKVKQKVVAHAMTYAVIDYSFYHFLESARIYLKFICDRFLGHSTRSSKLLKGRACLDFAVIFHLPKEQAAV